MKDYRSLCNSYDGLLDSIQEVDKENIVTSEAEVGETSICFLFPILMTRYCYKVLETYMVVCRLKCYIGVKWLALAPGFCHWFHGTCHKSDLQRLYYLYTGILKYMISPQLQLCRFFEERQ